MFCQVTGEEGRVLQSRSNNATPVVKLCTWKHNPVGQKGCSKSSDRVQGLELPGRLVERPNGTFFENQRFSSTKR